MTHPRSGRSAASRRGPASRRTRSAGTTARRRRLQQLRQRRCDRPGGDRRRRRDQLLDRRHPTNYINAVEVAFLFAAEAGVFVAAAGGNSGPARLHGRAPAPWIRRSRRRHAIRTRPRPRSRSGTAGRTRGARSTSAVGPAPPIVLCGGRAAQRRPTPDNGSRSASSGRSIRRRWPARWWSATAVSTHGSTRAAEVKARRHGDDPRQRQCRRHARRRLPQRADRFTSTQAAGAAIKA